MEVKTTPIQRTVFSKNNYPKVIDTTFRELVIQTTNDDQFRTVDYLFQLYEDIFYEIPPTGLSKSHEYLVQKSTDYIGIETRSSDVEALLAEINTLRRQLLEANQNIINTANVGGG
jgi:tRNA threonylcarbamoyladenosine modification (KEOPS) complex  Pcc1 subunit